MSKWIISRPIFKFSFWLEMLTNELFCWNLHTATALCREISFFRYFKNFPIFKFFWFSHNRGNKYWPKLIFQAFMSRKWSIGINFTPFPPVSMLFFPGNQAHIQISLQNNIETGGRGNTSFTLVYFREMDLANILFPGLYEKMTKRLSENTQGFYFFSS